MIHKKCKREVLMLNDVGNIQWFIRKIMELVIIHLLLTVGCSTFSTCPSHAPENYCGNTSCPENFVATEPFLRALRGILQYQYYTSIEDQIVQSPLSSYYLFLISCIHEWPSLLMFVIWAPCNVFLTEAQNLSLSKTRRIQLVHLATTLAALKD